MAEGNSAVDLRAANLNLTNEEKRVYHQLFLQADTGGLGVVTGDVAVKFFERTKLNSTVLGQIWQIADTDNRGLLTPTGFSIVLRLIGHCQAGRNATPEVALQPGPLPRFEDSYARPSSPPSAVPTPVIQPQNSGPIRVPPLTQDKISHYTAMFDSIGTSGGLLSGEAAKQFFEKAKLPNEVLGRIWTLADTEQMGALGVTQFIIAMHLLASVRSGALRVLPQTLPAGLYEVASRAGALPPSSSAIPRQISSPVAQRTSSPLARPPYTVPPAVSRNLSMPSQPAGGDWLISSAEKAKYDQIFATVDKSRVGYITGDEAVQFFSNSGLSEDALASIWDLADVKSEGKLNSDEFAVAMYLIRQQRARKDGREDLPATLPPALIPPSMRPKVIGSQQATAAGFDSTAFPTQQPKSAADDLFGLDAMSDAAPVRQLTGPLEADSFATTSSVSPPPTRDISSPSRSPATSFKPFVPTSSFGQGLASQTTGSSFQSSNSPSRNLGQTLPPTHDDLLGDNDSESNNKIAADSTELANMSNQIGILRTQMQSVQTKKNIAENNVTQTSKQKLDLELRLAQFRSQYEQEVKTVKSLEEQLAASRAETRKMQQEFAMVDGAYKDLQSQHRTFAIALEADQRENASLKERIRQVNAETAILRPQLDKIKSDARQQKGLVAINKKQLATSESERDNLNREISSSQIQNVEPTRDFPSPTEPSNAPAISPAVPTAEQSTNPFFRTSTSQPSSIAMSPSGFAPEIGSPQGHSAFESIFGPSQATDQSAGPPPTTFKSANDPPVPSIGDVEAARSTSPSELPNRQASQYSEPPPPPVARQITSNILPLNHSLDSTESLGSSVKANPPTSPFESSRAATPKPLSAFATPAQSREVSNMHGEPDSISAPPPRDNFKPSFDKEHTPEMPAPTSNEMKPTIQADDSRDVNATTDSIPGAFPSDEFAPPIASASGESLPIEKQQENTALSQSNPFAAPQNTNPERAPIKGDFDAAFDGFNTVQDSNSIEKGDELASGSTADPANVTHAKNTNAEFPPIEDLNEDESDSDSEAGFEDNFTAASPEQDKTVAEHTQDEFSPSTGAANPARNNTLPSANFGDVHSEEAPSAVKDTHTAPPVHENATAPMSNGNTNESNQFQDFGGLLPSPEMSSPSPTGQPRTSQPGFLASIFGTASQQTEINGPALTQGAPAQTTLLSKAVGNDDFDAAFDNLSEAKEADQGQEDIGVGSSGLAEHEFDPTFDSPAPSKSTTLDFQQPSLGINASQQSAMNNFMDVSQNTRGATQAVYSDSQRPVTSKEDWDDIFSGLDDSREADTGNGDPFDLQHAPIAETADTVTTSAAPQRPAPPGRTVTTGEHDDPILQRLTGMGYPRPDALQALEKYDYNIEKAADYLTSKT